jgi:hypothetical protein
MSTRLNRMWIAVLCAGFGAGSAGCELAVQLDRSVVDATASSTGCKSCSEAGDEDEDTGADAGATDAGTDATQGTDAGAPTTDAGAPTTDADAATTDAGSDTAG